MLFSYGTVVLNHTSGKPAPFDNFISIEMKQKEKLGEDLLLTSAQGPHYYSGMRYTLLLNSPTEYCVLEEEAGALCYAKNRV